MITGLRRHTGGALCVKQHLLVCYELPTWTATRKIFQKCTSHHITATMFKMLGLTHTWGLPSLLLHFLAFLLFLIFNHSDLLTTSQPHLHTLFLRKPSFFAFVCFLPLVSLGIMSPELGPSVRYCPWKQQPASVPLQEQGLWSPPDSAPGQPSDPGSHTYICLSHSF